MIQLNNLHVAYEKTRPVLKNINLTIEPSEILVLWGKSGSGKSTLLKVLSGLLPPISGEYFLRGENVYRLSETQRKKKCTQKIGFVWQNYRLIPEVNVERNILLPALINKAKVTAEDLHRLTELLGIRRYLHQYPDKLSGGEQQRVALARALILRPEIVIADEPTGALDSKTAAQLIELFLKTKEEFGTLFIIATHDAELASVGGRRLELSDGQVVNDEQQA